MTLNIKSLPLCECHVLFIIKLRVIMLNVNMLSVAVLNVVRPIVVAPKIDLHINFNQTIHFF